MWFNNLWLTNSVLGESTLWSDMNTNFLHSQGNHLSILGKRNKQERFHCQISLKYNQIKIELFLYHRPSQSLYYAIVHFEFTRRVYLCTMSQLLLESSWSRITLWITLWEMPFKMLANCLSISHTHDVTCFTFSTFGNSLAEFDFQ